MKHLLEYEDHEIEDLLSDLKGVGLADKMSYSLWVVVPAFVGVVGYTNRVVAPIALGDGFWSRGNFREDENQILTSLQGGAFVRPSKPGLDWRTLSAGERNLMSFLTPESLQTFLRSCRGNLGQCLEKMRDGAKKTLSKPGRNDALGFVVVYGREGDPDLLISPTTASWRVAPGLERVVFEDLTVSEDAGSFGDSGRIVFPLLRRQ